MYTLEECAAYWKETGKHGTKEERIARGRSWHPYYGYIAQKQLGKPWTPDPTAVSSSPGARRSTESWPTKNILI